jgi:DNA replication licensing factor MCM7
LEAFKTQKKIGITDALVDMNIDEDDFSDEYDFVDSDDEGQQARRTARQQAHKPKAKYMDLLQNVSNRIEDEITIELDDLAQVCQGWI